MNTDKPLEDDMPLDDNSVPIYDWQIKELDRRAENLKRNPDSGMDWESVKRHVRGLKPNPEKP